MKYLILLTALLAGCGVPSIHAHKPASDVRDSAVVEMWAAEIRTSAQPGDWLLTRNYELIGDVISLFSLGESLSHSAIYDPQRDAVVESSAAGVKVISLEKFLSRYRRVILARPNWMTQEERSESLGRAYSMVGAQYDYTGLLGFDDDSRVYCSEFVLNVIDPDAHGIRRPVVVTPAGLLKVADVLYDGGIRDSKKVRHQALARKALASN